MPEPGTGLEKPRYSRIVTHDDFDGVVSAVLVSLAERIEVFLFTGPGSILNMGLGIGPDTIVCDLPHHPAAGLWFDHHAGNLEDYRLKGGDPAAIRGAFSPEKSCARVVFNHFAAAAQFPDFLVNTVEEADTIDSFDYRNIEEWQRETPGKAISETLRVPFETFRERTGYLRHLIRRIRAAPLAEVAGEPEVRQRIASYRETAEKNRVVIERLGSFLPGDKAREIVLLDTTALKHEPSLIKSLAFLSFPDADAVLEVRCLFRQKRKTNDLGFSLSLSPRLEVQTSARDVGEIMRTLNMGDGHRGAGAGKTTCGSKAAMLKVKEETLREILALWRRQAQTPPPPAVSDPQA